MKIIIKLLLCASLFFQPLTALEFLHDSPATDHLGYHNCDMNTNGEREVLNLIQDNKILFDIGAHTGDWSLNALKKAPQSKIYAFEPIPLIFQKLRENLNSSSELFLLAVSDEVKTQNFIYYPKYPWLSTLHQRHEVEKDLKLTPVNLAIQTERLDNFCHERGINHIHFVKIDTEGNERNVLLGAGNLIKKGQIDYIQFEYGGCYLDSKSSLEEIYNYLTTNNYLVFRISPKALIHISIWRPELECYYYSNYFAIHSDFFSKISEGINNNSN